MSQLEIEGSSSYFLTVRAEELLDFKLYRSYISVTGCSSTH